MEVCNEKEIQLESAAEENSQENIEIKSKQEKNKVSEHWFVSFIKSELFLYLVVGGLTTLVNLTAFYFLGKVLNVSENNSAGWKLAEILAFIIAVIFAFIANKIFVFKSIDMSKTVLSKEIIGFLTARVLTEVINFFIMWIMIDKKGFNEFFTKVLASVVVIILNYVFSKFFIFKNNLSGEKV